jgi:hypothetical protein
MNTRRIINQVLEEKKINNFVKKLVTELSKSTYNNAAAKAVEKGDKKLALDFLKHSNKMGIDKESNENHGRSNRYMFFSNLQQMRRQCDLLLDLDEEMVESILNNGHDWAQDHIAEAKNNMDQVFDFIMNESKKDGMELSMSIDDKDMVEEGRKKTGTKLCARGKSAAKAKFDVYPSAYANGYAVQVCKGKIKGLDGKKHCSGSFC